MPYADAGEYRVYYEVDGEGRGPPGADRDPPPVCFLGDAGFGAWAWAWQHGAVAGPYEVVVPDTPGCGRSEPTPGAPSVGALAHAVEAVLSDCDARRTVLVGAGLGGAVALRYAREFRRADSLVLLGTPAAGAAVDYDPLRAVPDDEAALRASTTAVLSEAFVEGQPDAVDRIVEWRAAEDAPLAVRDEQVAALAAFDAAEWLHELTLPALVVHGGDDGVCPPAAGRDLAEGLPRGEFVPIEDAGHLVGVEAARTVNDQLRAFLDG